MQFFVPWEANFNENVDMQIPFYDSKASHKNYSYLELKTIHKYYNLP